MFRLWGSWYSFRPAWTHDFNAKIGSEKEVPSHEILSKICQNLDILLKKPIFGTYSPISLDSLHLFQIRLMRWNRESKPVEKSTMNPINGTNFFLTFKGAVLTLFWHFPMAFLTQDPFESYGTYTNESVVKLANSFQIILINDSVIFRCESTSRFLQNQHQVQLEIPLQFSSCVKTWLFTLYLNTGLEMCKWSHIKLCILFVFA